MLHVGVDPESDDSLQKTPERYVKALEELTVGYRQKPSDYLRVTFESDCDEMVVVRDIPFHSLCEHHLLPFHGSASIAYLPKGRVVGLSKLPRLVHCFARRFQMQERLTRQIADAIMQELQPHGAACVINAHHTCMSMRGVKSQGAMVTSCLLGQFREPAARAEFLRLLEV